MDKKLLHRYIDESVARHNLRNIGTKKNINLYVLAMVGGNKEKWLCA